MKTKVNELVKELTEEQKQLLKDTINYGAWGTTSMEFRNESGKVETVDAYGYCTNDAKRAGHFSGRKVSVMFRNIYGKLCPDKGCGTWMTQIHDWWGDGTGDMLFIRASLSNEFDSWAKM